MKSTVTNIAFIYFIYVRAEDEHFDRAQFYIWKSGLKRTVTIQPKFTENKLYIEDSYDTALVKFTEIKLYIEDSYIFSFQGNSSLKMSLMYKLHY